MVNLKLNKAILRLGKVTRLPLMSSNDLTDTEKKKEAHHWKLHNTSTGEHIGWAEIHTHPDEERIHVSNILHDNPETEHHNLTGVFKQLRKEYPWAKTITGHRLTGRHLGPIEAKLNKSWPPFWKVAETVKLNKGSQIPFDYRKVNDPAHRASMSRRIGAFDAIARHHGYKPDANVNERHAHGKQTTIRSYTHPETKHELKATFFHSNHPLHGRWTASHSEFGPHPFFGTGSKFKGLSQLNKTLSKIHGTKPMKHFPVKKSWSLLRKATRADIIRRLQAMRNTKGRTPEEAKTFTEHSNRIMQQHGIQEHELATTPTRPHVQNRSYSQEGQSWKEAYEAAQKRHAEESEAREKKYQEEVAARKKQSQKESFERRSQQEQEHLKNRDTRVREKKNKQDSLSRRRAMADRIAQHHGYSEREEGIGGNFTHTKYTHPKSGASFSLGTRPSSGEFGKHYPEVEWTHYGTKDKPKWKSSHEGWWTGANYQEMGVKQKVRPLSRLDEHLASLHGTQTLRSKLRPKKPAPTPSEASAGTFKPAQPQATQSRTTPRRGFRSFFFGKSWALVKAQKIKKVPLDEARGYWKTLDAHGYKPTGNITKRDGNAHHFFNHEHGHKAEVIRRPKGFEWHHFGHDDEYHNIFHASGTTASDLADHLRDFHKVVLHSMRDGDLAKGAVIPFSAGSAKPKKEAVAGEKRGQLLAHPKLRLQPAIKYSDGYTTKIFHGPYSHGILHQLVKKHHADYAKLPRQEGHVDWHTGKNFFPKRTKKSFQEDMPEQLKLACPQCKRKLHGAPFMRNATSAIDRNCPKCKSKWRVIVEPMGSMKIGGGEGFAHKVKWTAKSFQEDTGVGSKPIKKKKKKINRHYTDYWDFYGRRNKARKSACSLCKDKHLIKVIYKNDGIIEKGVRNCPLCNATGLAIRK